MKKIDETIDKMKVIYANKEIELPVLHGTEGADCVDIGTFEKELNLYTSDPAFVSTASCHSNITFIDGDKGILAHRGYAIEELAGHRTFLETFSFCSRVRTTTIPWKNLSNSKKRHLIT